MATPDEIAVAYQHKQKRIQRAAIAAALTLWRRLNQDALTQSWNAGIGQSMVQMVTQAQLQAVMKAPAYLEELAAAQGVLTDMSRLIPESLTGVALDGRPLESLLYLPIILFKRLLSDGKTPGQAMEQAQNFLAVVAATQVADAGRGAVDVGITATRQWVTYVRVVELPACSRCIILAGRGYSWSTGFQRHPACDCTMRPVSEGDPRPASPDQLFAQMSEDEQNRRFGKGAAEAIRLGGDMAQIVNARRGMQTAGGRLITTEGTTVRGFAGRKLGNLKKVAGQRYRRSQSVRPMPEQLIADADGDRDEAIRLLTRFGYLASASTSRGAPTSSRADNAPAREENEALRGTAGDGDRPPPPRPPVIQGGPGPDEEPPPIGTVLGRPADRKLTREGDPTPRSLPNADADFRYIDDPDERATALLQYEYTGRMILEHVADNLRSGRTPFADLNPDTLAIPGEDPLLMSRWFDWHSKPLRPIHGHYDADELRKDVLAAAFRLNRWADHPQQISDVYKGLRIPGDREELLRRYVPGHREHWRRSSFTSKPMHAQEYADTSDPPRRLEDAIPVIFYVAEAAGVKLANVGRTRNSGEIIVDGRFEVVSAEYHGGRLEVHWRWLGTP